MQIRSNRDLYYTWRYIFVKVIIVRTCPIHTPQKASDTENSSRIRSDFVWADITQVGLKTWPQRQFYVWYILICLVEKRKRNINDRHDGDAGGDVDGWGVNNMHAICMLNEMDFDYTSFEQKSLMFC